MSLPPWPPLPRNSHPSCPCCSCMSPSCVAEPQSHLVPISGHLIPISGHCFSPCLPSSAHAPLGCGRHILHTNEIINGTEVSLEILLLLSERLAYEGLALPCCSSSSASKHLCLGFFYFSWAKLSHHRVPQRCKMQTLLQAPSNLNALGCCLHF